MIVEDERWRAAEAERDALKQRLAMLERPGEEIQHLNAILWADRDSVSRRTWERRPAEFAAVAALDGQPEPSDTRLSGPMVVHEAHVNSPRLPSSFRHLTPAERQKLGLGPTEAAVAHDTIVRDGLVTVSRTTYWRNPPAAVLNLLLLCGDGVPAPSERELRAAGWRDAGGAAVPNEGPAG